MTNVVKNLGLNSMFEADYVKFKEKCVKFQSKNFDSLGDVTKVKITKTEDYKDFIEIRNLYKILKSNLDKRSSDIKRILRNVEIGESLFDLLDNSEVVSYNEKSKLIDDVLEDIRNELKYVSFLFYKAYVNNHDLIKLKVSEDKLVKAEKNEKRGDLNKYLFIAFSKFINIEDLKINLRAKIWFKNLRNVFDVDQDLLSVYNSNIKNLSYKTNYKKVVVFKEDLDSIAFKLDLLDESNFRELLKDINVLNHLFKIYSVGIKRIIIVDKSQRNINLDIDVYFNQSSVLTVKIMSLDNLISETRLMLYGERISETENYKKLDADIKKYIKIPVFENHIIKDSSIWFLKLQHKNINYINDFYKNSLFFIKGFDWNDISFEFRKNNIILSSGINQSKGNLDLISYKLNRVLNCLFSFKENKVYEVISNSYNILNNVTKSSNLKKSEIVDPLLPDVVQKYTFKFLPGIKTVKDLEKLKFEIVEFSENINASLYSTKASSAITNKLNNTNLGVSRKYHSSVLNIQNRKYNTISNEGFKDLKKKNTNENLESLRESNNNNRDYFLMEFKKIIKNRELSKEAQQLECENLWFNYIYKLKTDKKQIDNSLSFSLNYKINQIFNTLELKEKVLKKKFPKYANLALKVDNIMLALLIVVTAYTRRKNGWSNVASEIGNQIFKHWYFIELQEFVKKKNTSSDLGTIWEASKIYSYEEFLDKLNIKNINLESVYLGDFFLELMCQEPHVIFKREPWYESEEEVGKVTWNVILADSTYDELKERIFVSPSSLPMICKPLTWSDETKGGHLLNKIYSYSIISKEESKANGHLVENRENLYKAANYLSSLEFSVNTELLEFLNSPKGKVFIDELIEKNDSVSKSEKIQFLYNLKVAECFDNETFYLPIQADFRGRIYVKSFFLSYQSSEISKALVCLPRGKKLTKEGLKNLYIYGASLYNQNAINKENYSKRVNWVNKNLDKIYNMDKDFLKGAENVWLFISFCLVMRQLRDNNNYSVNLPIYIDATCSGIQHVAAMIKDLMIGTEVNLISQTKDDKVADIYSNLLPLANKLIQAEGTAKDSKYPLLKHVTLNRSDIKTPIMTKTYNVSLMGMKNQLILSLSKRVSKGAKLGINLYNENNKVVEMKKLGIKIPIFSSITGKIVELDLAHIFRLAQIIESCIFDSYPGLKLVYDYFKEIARLMNNLSLPIVWVTPANLKITQKYFKSTKTKISISYAGKTKALVLKEWFPKMDKRAQVNAIIPNIIHSLDASHLMEAVVQCDLNKIQVLPIHDCFGCHPNKIKKLYQILMLEFINIYSKEEFLTQFHENIITNIKNCGFSIIEKDGNQYVVATQGGGKIRNIPKKPQSGDLILSNIKKSIYMFTP